MILATTSASDDISVAQINQIAVMLPCNCQELVWSMSERVRTQAFKNIEIYELNADTYEYTAQTQMTN